MELTLNINVNERFCEAIELFAAAISMSNEGRFIGKMTPAVKVSTSVDKVATSVDKVASTEATPMPKNPALEKLKKELDLVEVHTPTLDELRAIVGPLLQKGYQLDIKGALTVCGAENLSTLAPENYGKFYDLIKDLRGKEAAA